MQFEFISKFVLFGKILQFVELCSIIYLVQINFERMELFMAYNIINNNPLVDAVLLTPDVVVSYDSDKMRFYVTFVATNSGNIVNRGELVSENFKFTGRIEAEILSYYGEAIDESKIVAGCEIDEELVDVIFTQRARNEIYMIWMANCDIS